MVFNLQDLQPCFGLYKAIIHIRPLIFYHDIDNILENDMQVFYRFFTIIKFRTIYFWTNQGHHRPLIDSKVGLKGQSVHSYWN